MGTFFSSFKIWLFLLPSNKLGVHLDWIYQPFLLYTNKRQEFLSGCNISNVVLGLGGSGSRVAACTTFHGLLTNGVKKGEKSEGTCASDFLRSLCIIIM